MWDTAALVTGHEIETVRQIHQKEYVSRLVPLDQQQAYEKNGWTPERVFSRKVRMRRAKQSDERFEDEVWLLLADLGFTTLNRNRQLRLPYGAEESLCQQIDVLAANADTVLLIECKVSDTTAKKGSFKAAIEAIGGRMDGLMASVRTHFPTARQIKFIMITKHYQVSQVDQLRMKQFGIHHIADQTWSYYQDLVRQLKRAARYPILADLFRGEVAYEADCLIPAIRFELQGRSCYTFVIDPVRLLKIATVVQHKIDAHAPQPTYQRVLTGGRLKSVQAHIARGGTFPNAIVVNLDLQGETPRFEEIGTEAGSGADCFGILHLPDRYASVQVIDGQHRLFGYIDAQPDAARIPVVAYANLGLEEQLRIFMSINDTQVSVSKNHKLTITPAYFARSTDPGEQRQALIIETIQQLGEEQGSPLSGRVRIGESGKTVTCCLTIDTLKAACESSDFVTRYKGRVIVRGGTLDRGDPSLTQVTLYRFLRQCFRYVQAAVPEEWNAGEAEGGLLTTNSGIYALIRTSNDILNHLTVRGLLRPKTDQATVLVQTMAPYLDSLLRYVVGLSAIQREHLRKTYGGRAKTLVWRLLQRAVAADWPDFDPDGMATYWQDNALDLPL